VAGTGYAGAGGSAAQIADAIRNGEGVVVIHGVDHERNGTDDVSLPRGVSELDPGLPADAPTRRCAGSCADPASTTLTAAGSRARRVGRAVPACARRRARVAPGGAARSGTGRARPGA
jgi:hypothetical protein